MAASRAWNGLIAFLSQSRFVTVDVSSGTEDLSLPVEFSVTLFTSAGRSSSFLALYLSAPAAHYFVALQRFVRDSVDAIVCIITTTECYSSFQSPQT